MQWVSRVLGATKPDGWVCLLGGSGLTDFRLRVAQSHVRSDLLPSLWSHVAVISRAGGASAGRWRLHDVPLEPARGFAGVAARNGVQEDTLQRYDDPEAYPNIALVDFHVDAATTRAAIAALGSQRSLIDVPALMIEWLAFAWGVGSRGNPLLAQVGIPSAAFVEEVFAASGLELTPGLSARSSCPEAIWQAAKWWQDFYRSEAMAVEAPPAGKYVVGQEAAAVVEPG